jgi:hypothetical protein
MRTQDAVEAETPVAVVREEICPLFETRCCYETCGWWDITQNCCSIKSIAISLQDIHDKLDEWLCNVLKK